MEKRLLILSTSTGTGHNVAAEAVAEAWILAGGLVQTMDAMLFLGEEQRERVGQAYEKLVVNAPQAFGWLYQAGALYDKTPFTPPTHFFNHQYTAPLLNYLKAANYDAVLCSHLYPMEALSYAKEEGSLTIPSFSLMTDYAIIPFYAKTEVDYYFTSTEDSRQEFIERGYDPRQIITTGIPVFHKFQREKDREKAREALGLPLDGPVFSLMTGGMGYGDPVDIGWEILRLLPEACLVLFIGKNEKLLEKAQESFQGVENVRILSFTDQVKRYFTAADVLLTKPGGLSSTEAAVHGIPLVLTKPIPGIETKNQNYFVDKGLALAGNNPKEAASAAVRLFRQPGLAREMVARQHQLVPQNAAGAICRIIAEVVDGWKTSPSALPLAD